MSKGHRLAAIMFTDIQGYTKLMQENEDLAIDYRAKHRNIFIPETRKNNGKIIQYYGDGTLSIFESCVDALRCARDMQKDFQEPPAIPVRVGIHLGDIVLTEDDIIGNSVNIASRVESLGIPGSVLLSQKVYEEIKNKQEFQVKKLGKFHFKNDKEPRTIYALMGENLIVPKRKELHGKLQSSRKFKYGSWSAIIIVFLSFFAVWYNISGNFNKTSIKSLAVLPLNDRIGLDNSETYIIDGIHEEIITKLAKIGLDVRPYSTMVHYKNNLKTPTKIKEELDVDGIIEGSVFRRDSIYKIRVQIIDGSTQKYITDPYETEANFSNILSLYNDLVENIANQIKYTLSAETQSYLSNNPTVDPTAYDLYLRGKYYSDDKGSEEDLLTAIDYFNQALLKDSTFVDAHTALVTSYLLLGFSSTNPEKELGQFRKHIQLVREKDPFIGKDHHLMAMVKIFDDWDWEGATQELKEAIDNAPDSWEPYDSYCQLMWALGKMEQSIEAGKKAVKNDPKAHFAHCDLAWAFYFNKQYDQAAKEVAVINDKFPIECPHHQGLSLCLDIQKKLEIGQTLIPIIDKIERNIERYGNPVYNLSLLGYAHALQGNVAQAREIIEELEREKIPGVDKVYIALGEYDKAIEHIEKAIINRAFFQIYSIKMAPWYDPIRDDPRFQNILKMMGLSDQQLENI